MTEPQTLGQPEATPPGPEPDAEAKLQQSNPEQVIAEVTERVLIDHRIIVSPGHPDYHGEWYRCESCDYDTYDPTAWEEHVAPFVAAEVVGVIRNLVADTSEVTDGN